MIVADAACMAMRGVLYFLSFAGPACVLWLLRDWHPLVLLGLLPVGWLLAAITFTVLIVACKRLFFWRLPANNRFHIMDYRRAWSWSGSMLLMVTMWRSPFWRMVSGNSMLRLAFYRGMGMRGGESMFLGENAGVTEPWFVSIGRNVMMGDGAGISCHRVENGMVVLGRVELADDVTIGARTIIFPNVKIGTGATVGACSVVYSNTIIGSGELWMGNPAVRRKVQGPGVADAGTPASEASVAAPRVWNAEPQCVGAED
jgi:acetyltransferase-like isoleucine patch superfamily enzyme